MVAAKPPRMRHRHHLQQASTSRNLQKKNSDREQRRFSRATSGCHQQRRVQRRNLNRETKNPNSVIKRLTCVSPDSAMIALGSEMSGGISNVRAEDLTAINTESAIRIKTAVEGEGCILTPMKENVLTLVTVNFQQGLGQRFKQPVGTSIDFSIFEESELLNVGDDDIYPIAIKADASTSDRDESKSNENPS
ncbi:E3 ubiquitin-protein [Vigna angularis]|uniref:E3 ubiquitin-protein n=1 Tax=Phaseolus angularis TaxID=3914 RepID=A0A8T0KR52_PHAAN|nr:E3 ubiquitin-protein [Vigna angularis]